MEAMSVEYAAPEQFDPNEFGKPDSYTDIYQLGAVIYEMVTGRPPYAGGQAAIMHNVVYGDDPDPPSSRREAVPTALDDVVLRALQPEKPHRYRGSVDRLEDALREIRQGEVPAPGPSETRDWPTFQGGLARTSHRSTSGPTDSVTAQWRFQTDPVHSSPAVVDGTVYVGSGALVGYVYALDAITGTERWCFQTTDAAFPSPAVADGTIYVGCGDAVEDGYVYALDASDGTERWRFQTDGRVKSSPAVADGTVYVGSNDDHIYALDASDGTERWRFQTDRRVKSSPAIADDTVYVGSDDTHVYAL